MSTDTANLSGYVVTVGHATQINVVGPFADYDAAWAWLADRPAQAYGATTFSIAPLRAPQPTT